MVTKFQMKLMRMTTAMAFDEKDPDDDNDGILDKNEPDTDGDGGD